MKKLKFAVWIFVLWLFQTVFLRFIRVDGIGPELLFVFALCTAVSEKTPSYYIGIAVICGLAADIAAGGVPGFYMLTYTAAVLFVVWLVDIIYKDIILLFLPITLIFTFLLNTLSFFVHHSYLSDNTYLSVLTAIILPVMLYNCIAAIIINPLLKKTIYPRKKIRRR